VYEALIGDVPYLAGVHYNRGITALRSEDETTARARFQTALKYAANFEPAFDVLRNLYLSRRDQTFLKDLESAFGLPRPAAPDDPFGGQYDAQGYS